MVGVGRRERMALLARIRPESSLQVVETTGLARGVEAAAGKLEAFRLESLDESCMDAVGRGR